MKREELIERAEYFLKTVKIYDLSDKRSAESIMAEYMADFHLSLQKELPTEKYMWSDEDIAEWHQRRFFNKPETPVFEQLKAFRDSALKTDMLNEVPFYLVNILKHLTDEQAIALANTILTKKQTQPEQQGWISVKDRLPEVGAMCLVWDLDDMWIAKFGMRNGKPIFKNILSKFRFEISNVTHYFIPKPPTK